MEGLLGIHNFYYLATRLFSSLLFFSMNKICIKILFLMFSHKWKIFRIGIKRLDEFFSLIPVRNRNILCELN